MQKLVRIAGAIVLLAAAATAQQPTQDAEPQQPRSGIGLTSMSTYVTRISGSDSAAVSGSPWSQPIFIGGLSLDAGWHMIRPTTTFMVDYHTAYDWNNVFSQFNGFSHVASIALRSRQGRRLSFALTATAEQRRLASTLFEPLGTVTLSRTGSFQDLTASLGEVRNGSASLEPALDLWLFGQNMRRAAGYFTTTFAQTPRLAWYGTASGERMLPIAGSGPASPAGFVYNGVTSGSAAGGFQYSLSRRTFFGASASYGRSFSSLLETSSAGGGFNLSHYFTEHWFGYGSVGYARMSEARTSNLPVMNAYEASAGLGASRGAHTFMLIAHRGLSSRYGLGMLRSEAGEVSWTWRPVGRAWTVAASGNFERLTGATERLEGWTGRFGITRRLAGNFSSSAEVVYTGIDGRLFGSVRAVAARVALTWTPTGLWP